LAAFCTDFAGSGRLTRCTGIDDADFGGKASAGRIVTAGIAAWLAGDFWPVAFGGVWAEGADFFCAEFWEILAFGATRLLAAMDFIPL